MKKILNNKKVFYISVSIIILMYVWMICTGGIIHGIMIYDNVKINNGGPLDPSDTGNVAHNEITLFYNTIIIILAIVIILSFWAIDRENKLKKAMLILIILFSIFTPIIQINSYKDAITIAGERKDMRKDEQIKNYNLIQVFLGKD